MSYVRSRWLPEAAPIKTNPSGEERRSKEAPGLLRPQLSSLVLLYIPPSCALLSVPCDSFSDPDPAYIGFGVFLLSYLTPRLF